MSFGSRKARMKSISFRPQWFVHFLILLVIIAIFGLALFEANIFPELCSPPEEKIVYIQQEAEISTTPPIAKPIIPRSIDTQFSRKETVRIGFCPGWHEIHAGMLAKYLFQDRPYVFEKMDRDGMKNGQVPDVDVLICTGWNFNAKLRELHSNSPKISIPTELKGTWTNQIYFPHTEVHRHKKGRPFTVAFNAEAWGRGKCEYDVIFDCKKQSFFTCPTIFMPFATQSFGERGINVPEDLIQPYNFDADSIFKQKRKFAVFMVTSCLKRQHDLFALIRVVFFDMLSEYKQVDSISGCRNNARPPFNFKKQLLLNRALTFYDESVFYYQPYKFVIAFENDIVTGYFTEKLLNGVFSNSIPIYFGANDILEYINPKRLVVCMNLSKKGGNRNTGSGFGE